MALDGLAITAAIAALNIAGMTTKDVADIPDQVQVRDCPIFFPQPNGLLDGSNSEPSNGPATFGTPSTRFWIFSNTFTYVYLHAAAGTSRSISDHNPGMMQAADAIRTALVTIDLPYVDVQSIRTDRFGVIKDPSDKSFLGFLVSITFRERINP
jgi:hypothetical protein